MSIQLQDVKLYLKRSDLQVKISISQHNVKLHDSIYSAEQTPILISLPFPVPVEYPITFSVNDYAAEVDLSKLEQKQYKLDLVTSEIIDEPIRGQDEWKILFKIKKSLQQNQNSTISSIDSSLLRHKLLENGKGTSQFQSSSSLRHSIPEVSFTTSQTFNAKSEQGTEFNYEIPSTLSAKGTSLGFGNKYINPIYVQRNAVQNPPPDAYNLEKKQQSALNKNTDWAQSDRFRGGPNFVNPSPSAYDLNYNLGSDKPNYSIGNKLKHIPTFQESVPGPNRYEIKTKIVEPSRYKNISLGYGQKSDFTKTDLVPGPGTYEITSVFQKNSSNNILRTNIMRQ
ncbi:hypothetical protein pb186bvf_005745 [Paramecium bursaria]